MSQTEEKGVVYDAKAQVEEAEVKVVQMPREGGLLFLSESWPLLVISGVIK